MGGVVFKIVMRRHQVSDIIFVCGYFVMLTWMKLEMWINGLNF